MFRLCSTAIVVASFLVVSWTVDTQDKKQDQKDEKKQEQKPLSPTETITEMVGGKGGPEIKIVYSRPFTKDPKSGEMRKIWGGLVPYGKAWRTGANLATAFETTAPITVGGASVPAGKYTIYMIPEEKGTSKLAISKTTGQPGDPVDEKNDLVRVDLKKDTLPKSVDQFTIVIESDKGQPSGTLKLMWETTQFSVPLAVSKK